MACTVLHELGYETEVCQIAVSRSRSAGDLTLMLAQNPVWLITGTGT
jgi:precorrin-6Y C5,15-methyltransferase (decarboxylating)